MPHPDAPPPRPSPFFVAVAAAVALTVAVTYAVARQRGVWPVGHPWIAVSHVMLAAWAVFQQRLNRRTDRAALVRAAAALAMSVVGCAVWTWANVVVWSR